jgi:carbonic anhydrase
VDWPKGATLRIHDHTYDLAQFHFHWPSEHVVGGRRSALEMHLVFDHRNETLRRSSHHARLAVLGVLFELGEASPFLDQILDSVPDEVGASAALRLEMLEVERVVDQPVYSLGGSLTTEPFSEGVNWCISAQPLTLSCCQLDRLIKSNLMQCNHRAVQALGRRHVETSVLHGI